MYVVDDYNWKYEKSKFFSPEVTSNNFMYPFFRECSLGLDPQLSEPMITVKTVPPTLPMSEKCT